ncbi:hypothetical protein F5887DRAFT_1184066 [Amanita rubescens]|nr:hypothetical protein F5887DRAFT_1184066 [Amanita rubescens]
MLKITLKTAIVLANCLSPLFQAVAGLAVAARQNSVTFSDAPTASIGAAYFMSNDPSGNYVFSADIGPDAKLTLAKGYYTGGNGSHGVGPTPDALFSQGAMISSKTYDVVIAVNAGSNTITAFQVDQTNPTNLVMIGSPVYSGGDFPVSVAINEVGNMVCALNSGTINGVSCFQFDPKIGLTPLANATRYLNLEQTTPPSGPDNTVGQVIFRKYDTALVVIVKGAQFNTPVTPGHLAEWDINPDGSLSENFNTVIGGVSGCGISEIPGMNALIVPDSFTGYVIFDLAAAIHDPAVKGQSVLIPGQEATCWIGYSVITKNFYLTDFGTSMIYEINVDENLKGTLVKSHLLDEYDGPLHFEINHVLGQERMYLLAGNNSALEVFNINGVGQLEQIQKLDIGTPIRHAGLPLDPNDVFGMVTYMI